MTTTDPATDLALSPAGGLPEPAFYAELTARNAGVIDPATQEILRNATVLVAGCGSIGGAAWNRSPGWGSADSSWPIRATTRSTT
jgi:hypothetical protein